MNFYSIGPFWGVYSFLYLNSGERVVSLQQSRVWRRPERNNTLLTHTIHIHTPTHLHTCMRSCKHTHTTHPHHTPTPHTHTLILAHFQFITIQTLSDTQDNQNAREDKVESVNHLLHVHKDRCSWTLAWHTTLHCWCCLSGCYLGLHYGV